MSLGAPPEIQALALWTREPRAPMFRAMTLAPRAPAALAAPSSPRAARPALLDRPALAAEIAALRAAHSDDAGFRKAAVEAFRGALAKGHAQARAWLFEDHQGLGCARRLSALQDGLILSILDYVTTYVYPAVNPSSGEQIAIVAVGGYGRGTLAPGSDVDLLFLIPHKETAWVESVVEAMLYVLWDLRQKVGHATRSVEECLRQARGDMTIRTALLDARLIGGKKALFDDFAHRFDAEIVRKTPRDFVAAKLAERETRVSRAGQSRYLVEPNVKEGKGGLRDLNTLEWILKYVHRVDGIDALAQKAVLSGREATQFKRCSEFLWRVRCVTHFIAGRAEERLSFDLQRPVSDALGYRPRQGLSAVERFMKHYFLIAKDVGDLTAIVCASLEEGQAKPVPVLDRLFAKLRRRPRDVEGLRDFALETGRLTVADARCFERDPVNIIRLYWLAARGDMAIHPHATRLVTESLKRIDAALRENEEANRLFLELLTSGPSPEVSLRRMNEAGALGRFVPEFGKVVAMMQFNMYHHYTVDEHLLRSLGELSALKAGAMADEAPLASEIVKLVADPVILPVALFLHDIAKGREEDHSLAGARVARKLCPRFGLDPAQTETVAWLIEEHLTMSTTAQSRDLSDPRTIETFAATCQTLDRLRMLHCLTLCDIRAVGPGVWNGWKAQLLRTLYWETEMRLSGGHSTVDRKGRVAAAQEELKRALNLPDADFETYAERHYAPYWLKVDLGRKVQHAKLLRLAEREMRSLETEVTTDAFRGVTEITVLAPDHPRLLSILTGACAASGANIVDAQIFTTTDGLALDAISVSRAFDMDADELRRGQRIAASVEKALRGQLKLGEAIAARGETHKDRHKTFSIAPSVRFDNTLSRRHSVIEVSGLDRTGLLYELTTAISDLNLNIASAHIATFGEKAVDVFYVTDLTGAMIQSPQREAAIRKRLTEVFVKPAAAKPAPAKGGDKPKATGGERAAPRAESRARRAPS
jgi:[protein-PII] uridylyltransferase